MTAKSHEFEVVLQPEEEGGFSVSVLALSGCHTQGETRDEALTMAKDAIEGYLEVLEEEGRPVLAPSPVVATDQVGLKSNAKRRSLRTR